MQRDRAPSAALHRSATVAAEAAPTKARGEFARGLREQGLVLGRTEGDGNCFFRAISDQLNNDGGKGHLTVRREVVAYMRANPAAYRSFVQDEDARSLELYLANMSREKVLGGEPEIDAASKRYNRSVVVHRREDQPRI